MLIFKSEDLTGKKILEKSPSRVKAKGKRLKIGTQSDDERGSSKPSSEQDSELDELVKQRKKKQKNKVNFSRARADERKEWKKEPGCESEHEYDDRVSFDVSHDSKLASNLYKILGTKKESEDEDSEDSVQKASFKNLTKIKKFGKGQ